MTPTCAPMSTSVSPSLNTAMLERWWSFVTRDTASDSPPPEGLERMRGWSLICQPSITVSPVGDGTLSRAFDGVGRCRLLCNCSSNVARPCILLMKDRSEAIDLRRTIFRTPRYPSLRRTALPHGYRCRYWRYRPTYSGGKKGHLWLASVS